MAALEMEESVTGTFCADSSRLRAVTTTSSSSVGSAAEVVLVAGAAIGDEAAGCALWPRVTSPRPMIITRNKRIRKFARNAGEHPGNAKRVSIMKFLPLKI